MSDVDVSRLPLVTELSGSLADRVYSVLKKAILTLEFAPGATIRKSAVCDWLNVSRSPVSDALTKLGAEGLVDIVPQSGTRVSRLSMTAIREGAFMREALEVAATQHAALHRSDGALSRLTRNVEMQKLLIADVDKEDFIYTDIAFHETIMATTDVSRLPGTVRMLSQHVDRARMLMVPEPGRLSDTVDEHLQILDAIRKRDSDAAGDAMRDHVRQLIKRLEPLEAARPDMFLK